MNAACSPLDRVFAALSFDAHSLLTSYYDEPLRPISALADEVFAYLANLEDLDGENEFLDIELARKLAAQCHALLAAIEADPSTEAHRLIQMAIRYYIEDEDAEGDTASPIGFDDDAEVVEAVAGALGLAEVIAAATSSAVTSPSGQAGRPGQVG